MDIFHRIDEVYQRTVELQTQIDPAQPALAAALQDLHLVLEELQATHEELAVQNRRLASVQQQLQVEKQRYWDLYNWAPDGYLVTDHQGVIQFANVAIAQLLGVAQEQLSGKPLVLYLPEADRRAFYALLAQLHQTAVANVSLASPWETQLRHRQGGTIDVAIMTSIGLPMAADASTLRWLIRNITEQKRAETEIRQLAFHDALTGLPNRAYFETYLAQAIAQTQRDNTRLAIVFLDLDNFKGINDSLGHWAGDQLLQQVAQRLQNCLRQGDCLVRWGGDEFIFVIIQAMTRQSIEHLCDRILASFALAFPIHQHELHISSSLGIAVYPNHSQDAETLIRYADQALYQAKAHGRNSYCFFEEDRGAHALETFQLEHELHEARNHQEFCLYFQPQVDVVSGAVTAFEALLRWQHPHLGLLAPAAFLGILENNGQIVEIGDWVLQAGIRQATIWHQAGFENIKLAINLSARQLRSPSLVMHVQQCLETAQYDPTLLEFEITETSAITHPQETHTTLQQLAELGITISLDDFGTGYSSLTLVKQLPLQKLKIDRSFVADLSTSPCNQAIIAATMTLAQQLNLQIVVEGVETAEQVPILQQFGLREMQGDWFARPMAAAQVLDFLRQRPTPPHASPP
ncbi:bifunctional diguanylate cyclase/phosphodiesterase [Halomicronema sp. CCY15110]|uniref:putative bifunctional diguanylate cyclase/phosphodiesterase n=1 Tax=Halomicronema sp. CCY15110 TaxID=2767773 RepID=UPI0019507D12|nr:EAL domain-containing protein [Halomicronema sp. CCY15110]